MILITDENFKFPSDYLQNIYQRYMDRVEKLYAIVDDENASLERRDWAYDQLTGYQEELQYLNELLKVPFDVLIVIEKGSNKRDNGDN